MKKIVLSVLTVASMVSANEIITDSSNREHDVGVVLGYDNTEISNGNVFNIGVNDTVKISTCGLKLSGDVIIGYSMNDSMTASTFLTVGAGVVSPTYIVWSNAVEGIAGFDLRHEFGGTTYLTPKVGVRINKNLEVSYKQYEESNQRVDTLGLSYKF